jgi:hypothetical protein
MSSEGIERIIHRLASAVLGRPGRNFRVAGGARVAGELDSVRSLREGAEAAYTLLSRKKAGGS